MSMNNTIIYVSPHVHLYGAERSMIANILNLKEKGYNVLVVIPSTGKIIDVLKYYDIEYIVVKFYDVINHKNRMRILYGLSKQVLHWLIALRVARLLYKKQINPILVHSNSIISNFGIVLSNVLKVPHIQHIREMGAYDFNMTFDLGISCFAKECSKSAKIICISNAVYQYYKQYLPDEKMKIIYNGIAEDEVDEVCSSRNVNQRLEMILVGRLSEEKGQIQAIQAVERLKESIPLHLDLWGDGVDREKIERYIKEHNLEELVSMQGYSNSIPYSRYHLALMCSHYEAFGRVTVEYMMHALPVIGVNAGGTQEIILPTETGYLYNDGDIDRLTEYILELYSNEEKRQRMGQNGMKRAKNEFSEDSYCKKVFEVYKEVCLGLRDE